MFVRYVSHEIRTPLSIVSMGLQLAKEELIKVGDVEETVRLLEDVKSSSDTAVGILNSLLTYDKIDTGTLVLEKEELPVWDFLSDTVRASQVQVYDISIWL